MTLGSFLNKLRKSLGIRGIYLKGVALVASLALILSVNRLTPNEAFQYFSTVGLIYIVTFFTGGGLNKFILSMRSNDASADVESVINFTHVASLLVVFLSSAFLGKIVLLGGLLLIFNSYLQANFWSKTESSDVNIEIDNTFIIAEIAANLFTCLFLFLRYIEVAVVIRPVILLLISIFVLDFRIIYASPVRFISSGKGLLKVTVYASFGRLVNVLASRGLVYTTQGVFSVDDLQIVGILEKISTLITSILNWFWNRIYLYFGHKGDYSYDSKVVYALLPIAWIILFWDEPAGFILSLTLVRIVKEYASFLFVSRFQYFIPFSMSLLLFSCVLLDIRSSTAIIVVFSIYSLLALLVSRNILAKKGDFSY